jgi:hypothetical protein
MQYEIKRLDLLSVFKISFLIYLVIGFLIGIFYSLILTQMMAMFSSFMDDQAFQGIAKLTGPGLIFLALFLAIFIAVMWSILTVIAAAIYNLLSGAVGGIKVELQTPPAPIYQQMTAPPPTPPAPPSIS